MPSLKGKKQRAKSKLSMKDALADIGNVHVDMRSKKSWSLRDFWNADASRISARQIFDEAEYGVSRQAESDRNNEGPAS